jgi:hypothetical protein
MSIFTFAFSFFFATQCFYLFARINQMTIDMENKVYWAKSGFPFWIRRIEGKISEIECLLIKRVRGRGGAKLCINVYWNDASRKRFLLTQCDDFGIVHDLIQEISSETGILFLKPTWVWASSSED